MTRLAASTVNLQKRRSGSFGCRSIGLIGLVAICTFAANASACPSCSDSIDDTKSLESSEVSEPVSLGRGFNTAIYLLLGSAMIGAGLVGGTLILNRADP